MAGERKPSKIALGVLILVVYVTCSMAPRSKAGTYAGTVVDGETGAPIEGALIVVVWYAGGYFKLDNWVLPDRDIAHTVRETTTDSEGHFTLKAGPGISWNPLYRLYPWPGLLVYAAGYAPWPDVGGGSLTDNDEMLRRGAEISLRRPRDDRERRLAMRPDLLGGHPEIPADSIPVLSRALDQYARDVERTEWQAMLARHGEPMAKAPRGSGVRYIAWDPAIERGLVETTGEGRRTVGVGDPIEGFGTVWAIDADRLELRRLLPAAEREELERHGLPPRDADVTTVWCEENALFPGHYFPPAVHHIRFERRVPEAARAR